MEEQKKPEASSYAATGKTETSEVTPVKKPRVIKPYVDPDPDDANTVKLFTWTGNLDCTYVGLW